ncbi:hypothetical protein HWV62_18724, partial [Athelia sp. TMB]
SSAEVNFLKLRTVTGESPPRSLHPLPASTNTSVLRSLMSGDPGTNALRPVSTLDIQEPLTPSKARDIEDILKLLGQKKITLGRFLRLAFTTPAPHSHTRHSQTQIQKVTNFLQGKSDV